MMAGMRIRIDAVDLPGLTCPAPVDSQVPVYGNIHVAVQRRDRPAELLAPQPGDAASATWILECTTSASPNAPARRGCVPSLAAYVAIGDRGDRARTARTRRAAFRSPWSPWSRRRFSWRQARRCSVSSPYGQDARQQTRRPPDGWLRGPPR